MILRALWIDKTEVYSYIDFLPLSPDAKIFFARVAVSSSLFCMR